jgi:single-stranded DNA-binding protein
MSGIEAALFGTLGRDGELKTSKAGKQYLRLNIRVGDGDGAQWVGATVFDPKAIAMADKMVKAARVSVEGKLSLDEWTAQDGALKHGLSVMSWHCRLSEIGRNKPRRQADDGGRQRSPRATNDFHSDEIPF